MTASKDKGSRAERAIIEYLRAAGWPHAERRLAGAALDRGDIAGVPGVVIEAKDCQRTDLAAWLAEAELERANDGAALGVVWHKRRGVADPAGWYVTMTGAAFVELLRAAGYGTPTPAAGNDHVWRDADDLIRWPYCRTCGVIKRSDGRPQSACKGPTRIELRAAGDVDDQAAPTIQVDYDQGGELPAASVAYNAGLDAEVVRRAGCRLPLPWDDIDDFGVPATADAALIETHRGHYITGLFVGLSLRDIYCVPCRLMLWHLK